MLKIWGRANSINVQKVLWCCGELGLRYERIDAGNEFGLTKSPEYRALNPNALVPTIEDGDFQLWESNVIVRYLAQKCQNSCLCPVDITTRFDSRTLDGLAGDRLLAGLAPAIHRTDQDGTCKTRCDGDIESRKPVARCRADPRRPSFRSHVSRR